MRVLSVPLLAKVTRRLARFRETEARILQPKGSMTPNTAREQREAQAQDLRRRELFRMRFVATALLVAMTAVFVATLVSKTDAPWLPYLRAFAEAGMVGACADWFAVVALFRHPLGLPIPHTRIVPANKDRVAEAFGRFVSTNFLARRTVNRKLEEIDLAGAFARWLAEPQNAEKVATFCAKALPELVGILPKEQMREAVGALAQRALQSAPIAPFFAHVLETLWAKGEAQALLDRAIVYAAEVLVRNKAQIRERVEKKAPRWLPSWIDAMLIDRVLEGLLGTLSSMRNPAHPWRKELQKSVQQLIRDLAKDPKFIAKGEELKARVLADPVFKRQTELMWLKLEEGLLFDLASRGDEVAKAIETGLAGLSQWLLDDPALAAGLNRRIRLTALRALPPRRAQIGAYVADVVRKWDSETLVEKLELSVGRDLQFIRINGTLVGGFVGLVIFALSKWIEESAVVSW